MTDFIRIVAVLVFLIVLVRKKVRAGVVLLLGSLLLTVLYLMPVRAVLYSVETALIKNPEAIKVALALTAIRGFELVLREKKILDAMMDFSKGLFRGKRALIASMPLLIGTLPAMGGAYFSAPMVEEASKGMGLPAEQRGFLNYWFRHPWEHVLPLYPGIVLAGAVTGIKLGPLMFSNLPYALGVAATGCLFGFKGIGDAPCAPDASLRGGKGKKKEKEKRQETFKGLLSFLPIFSILCLVIIFGVEFQWAILAALAGLFVFYRYNPREVWKVVKGSFSMDVLLLIAGVMVFKQVLVSSGAVANLGGFLAGEGIPLMVLLSVLPFLAGLLTGHTMAFVGATFPLLMALPGGGVLHAISFAFACGFLGVLLSPVHICLILSREYFKADLWGIYKRTIPAALVIFMVAVGEYLVFRG